MDLSICKDFYLNIFLGVLITKIARTEDHSENTAISVPSGYLGCFEDNGKNKILSMKIGSFKFNSGDQCKKWCKAVGFLYAGTKKCTDCYCGHTFRSFAHVNCSCPCSGNAFENCGGPTSISVYSTQETSTKSNTDTQSVLQPDKMSTAKVQITSPPLSSLHAVTYIPSNTGVEFGKTKKSTSSPELAANTLSSFNASDSRTVTDVNTTSSTETILTSTMKGTDFSLKRISKPVWVTQVGLEFLAVEIRQNFTAAHAVCSKDFNASLIAYTNPLQYFTVTEVLKEGHYWVGGGVDTQYNRCIALFRNHSTNTIELKNCNEKHYFICSRVSNASEIVNNPEFVNMLKNMSVNAKETNKAKRKVKSVQDGRRVSMVVGSAVGMLVTCVAVGFVIFLDIVGIALNLIK